MRRRARRLEEVGGKPSKWEPCLNKILKKKYK
jgi:hypothetical protein